MATELVSIENITHEENMGRLIKIEFAPTSWISSIPLSVAGALMDDIAFVDDKTWLTLNFANETAGHQQNLNVGSQGLIYQHNITGVLAKDRQHLIKQLQRMQEEEFVLRLTDSNGFVRYVGTVDAPATFSFSFNTNESTEAFNGYNFTFRALQKFGSPTELLLNSASASQSISASASSSSSGSGSGSAAGWNEVSCTSNVIVGNIATPSSTFSHIELVGKSENEILAFVEGFEVTTLGATISGNTLNIGFKVEGPITIICTPAYLTASVNNKDSYNNSLLSSYSLDELVVIVDGNEVSTHTGCTKSGSTINFGGKLTGNVKIARGYSFILKGNFPSEDFGPTDPTLLNGKTQNNLLFFCDGNFETHRAVYFTIPASYSGIYTNEANRLFKGNYKILEV